MEQGDMVLLSLALLWLFDWLFSYCFSIFLKSRLWNCIKTWCSSAWNFCKSPIFFLQQLSEVPEKPKCSIVPGLKNRIYKPSDKFSKEEQAEIQKILNDNYTGKYERLRSIEKQNYLCRMYQTFKFSKIHFLKIAKTDKISDCDLNKMCDISAESVHDLKTLLKTKEIFQKFLKQASQGINPQPYLREHLPIFMSSINQIVQSHGNFGFPVKKDCKSSELLECCWKVGDGKDERYLEVKFFEKPTEIGGLVFHEVVSIGVIGKKRFRNYYKRTSKATFESYQFVQQDQTIPRLLSQNNLESIREAEKTRLESIPKSYWHIEEGTSSLEPIPGSRSFFHSESAPSSNAFLIKFEDNSKIRSLEELEEEYYKQKPADLIYDEGYESFDTNPEDSFYWNEFVKQEILEKSIEGNTNKDQGSVLFLKGFRLTYKFDSKEEGPYHILIRHWDQFEVFLEVHGDDSNVGKQLSNLYTQILQQQKEEDGFDEDLDRDPKIVELEKQMTKISEDNKALLSSLQQKLIQRLSQLLNHEDCSGGQFKSSHNTNMILNYEINFGKNRKRCLFVIVSVDKLHGYSLRTAYFVAPQRSRLEFDGLGYWYDMENGKIVVKNRRDFERSSNFDNQDQSVFTSPIQGHLPHPNELSFSDCDFKEVISIMFLSQSLLSTDNCESYVISGISKELIAMIKQNIINLGAKQGGVEVGAAIQFNIECSSENEKALKEIAESTIKDIMSLNNRTGNNTSRTGKKVEFYELEKAKWVLECKEKMIKGSKIVQKSICFKTSKEI